MGTLVELLVQRPGIGEMRLLAPALREVADRHIVLLQPPQAPQALAFVGLGLPLSAQLWLRAERAADALWAAEQVLRSGSCGALLYWPQGNAGAGTRMQPVRNESLRRLHLAAQQGETLFVMVRPLSAASDSSPAPLRLSVQPAPGGIDIGFVKRQGPRRDETLFIPMSIAPAVRVLPQRRELFPESTSARSCPQVVATAELR